MDEDEKQKYESLDSVKCGPVTKAGNKFSATSAEIYSMPNCGASIRKWSVIWRVPEQIITSLCTDFATSRVRYTKITKTTVKTVQVVEYLRQCVTITITYRMQP